MNARYDWKKQSHRLTYHQSYIKVFGFPVFLELKLKEYRGGYMKVTSGWPQLPNPEASVHDNAGVRSVCVAENLAELSANFKLLPYCFHEKPLWKQRALRRQYNELTECLNGAPEEIRTPDPQIRSLMRYHQLCGQRLDASRNISMPTLTKRT